ncbi:response regulator transcription factor [Serratia fonticola]|uniref:response regulator transcription factor n=1 Tax=Serratia fonticola TaxID=47917 RepID=UPI0005649DCD|nr:LuxR C-terminal-related transcriptional regulator [Serratia fonticola]
MLKNRKTPHAEHQLTICIRLRDNYFSQGLQSILRVYFDGLGICTTFIDGVKQRDGADILFCDASPYKPQLVCAKTSKYRRIFIVEHIPNTRVKTPCSCGCEDALFSYNTRPEEIIRKLGEVLVALPSEEKKSCLASTLSNRERQILYYISQGINPQKMSDALLISTKTQSAHKKHAMRKLNIDTSTGLHYWLRENAAHLLP